ncbi:uncharacterized protein MONOS_7626 [Monocercomonoides exilis]|uniref:uncharacterized protein n=1 Tax=Monocercomonoides exilis TaxID=2049356 RepID=UPI003559AE4D|nr:hypothetical protein MONOS_7626 [Monocercomonoides exilis]|eukprot:MONOS_7626.1-p1 / transcript=MONOS_7626.1 / gene=MONOS_7626 / organism=Monocercomonoides_exilis_PA203 / gene_product=unspecified product / transcript_product=unspecified product / location=Mono_scaffold00265:63344-64582(-) / protein_length=413 / sequence_SO=supercontig / SO=protein_coding / is_pseudo=false
MDRWKKKRRTLTKMQIKAAKDHQRLFGEWVKKSWMIDEEEEKMWEEAEKKIVVKENVEAQEEGIEIQQSNHTIEELKGMLLEISEHGLDGKEKEELEKEIARIERRQEKGEKNEAVSVLDRYLEEDQKRSAKGKKRYGWFPDVNVNKQKNGDKRFSSQASMLDHYAECEGDMSCDAVDELEERSKNEPLNQLNISQYPHSNEEIVPSQEKNTSPFLFLHNLENVSQNEHASIFPVFCQQTSTPAMASSVEKESSLDIPFPFSVNIQSSPHSSSKLHSSVQKFRQSLLIPPSSHSLSDHEAPCFDSRNKPNEESISFISHSLLSTIRENHEDDASLVKVINVENLLEHDSNIERGLKIDEAEVLRRFDNRFFSSRKNNHRLQNHIQLVEEVKRIQSIVIWLNPILTSRKQFRK